MRKAALSVGGAGLDGMVGMAVEGGAGIAGMAVGGGIERIRSRDIIRRPVERACPQMCFLVQNAVATVAEHRFAVETTGNRIIIKNKRPISACSRPI